MGFVTVVPITLLFSSPGCDSSMDISFWSVPVFCSYSSLTVLNFPSRSHSVTAYLATANLGYLVFYCSNFRISSYGSRYVQIFLFNFVANFLLGFPDFPLEIL